MLTMLGNASIVALISLFVAVLPMPFGLAYALRPTELRLALMRPISLGSLFGALGGTFAGAINVLRVFWITEGPVAPDFLAISSAEALVPLLVAFQSLTIGWLCAAVGFARQP